MQQTPPVLPVLVRMRAHSELFVALMGLRPPFPCSLLLERLRDADFPSKKGAPSTFLSVIPHPPRASAAFGFVDPAISVSRTINVKRKSHGCSIKMLDKIDFFPNFRTFLLLDKNTR